MSFWEWSAVLALAGLIGFVAYYIGIYNGAQRLINLIPEFSSNIAVLMKKRNDLIAKLVSVVDSYGLHESGIGVRVAGELGGSLDSSRHGMVERLASLRMAFPELKADGLYDNLMQELAGVETEIAERRERYNSTVRAYNTAISQFPSNVLLAPFGFEPQAFLSEQQLLGG